MDSTELAKSIVEAALLRGEFLLRSGKISDIYFDKYRFESQPNLLQEIAKQASQKFNFDCDALAGLEMGGIPIATAISFETSKPLCFVRKEAKTYGTCKFAEGMDIKGKKLFIIEDVITTGGQVIESTRDLRESGAIVEDVFCVIYRGQGEAKNLIEQGLRIHTLLKLEDLKPYMN